MEAGVTVIMVKETLRPHLLHEADTTETIYTYGLHNHTKYSKAGVNYLDGGSTLAELLMLLH